ncbi:acriflavine resistance protein B [Phreatobacter aquaticus]|uniref:Acriflavine resistance protein B n=1 Tax=Phreatobacter aquaticus TaxID=2570229 RepID=A0A4D7QSZ2_9HYPH|nr:efflux RND transporter permease subunit [Phreatobacter aquaticus]QCK88519.1 acriflavine resistance protein B [Phreatobacter aquaticus]
MNVSAPFIHRPIATSLLALALVLAGVLGYLRLPVSSLPQVEFPTIQVTTQLPGASPDTIAALVTAPLERQLGLIPALAMMTSSSSLGLSQVTLQFDLDRDIDAAAQDVQSAINAAGSALPRGLPYPPTYAKVNPADAPIITLAITSPTVPLERLADIADTLLAQRLAEISGVGRVSVAGNLKPAVRIQVDLDRLAAYRISLEDVRAAIVAANVAGPKGSLDGARQSFTIAANDQVTAAEAYKTVIISYRNNAPVLLADVANVVDGLENARVGAWYQGRPAIVMDIQRQPGANVVKTVERIMAELPRLERALPSGAVLTVVTDRTGTIKASIRDVQFTLALSVGLVVLVVLVFLRSWRATIVAGVALPLSLIVTFAVMYLAGFSLDNLSLMALTIGTGFVVDDAIVIIENIVRRMEKGEGPFEAALKGSKEIGFTIVSLTVSLVAVFIPLLFMSGLVGRMFREFALTLTIAVIASAVVSLTLSPMMCSRLLKAAPEPKGERKVTWSERLVLAYGRSVARVVEWPVMTLMVTLATLAITIWFYVVMPKGFLPPQDTGVLTATLQAGPTTSFPELRRLQEEASSLFRADPQVAGVVSVAGAAASNPTTNMARMQIVLRPRDDRAETAGEIAERLQAIAVDKLTGLVVIVRAVSDIQIGTTQSRAAFQYTLVGASRPDVVLWATRLAERVETEPGFRNVSAEIQEGGGRVNIRIDREAASRLGVSIQAIDDTLYDAYGQRQISTIYAQTNQYRVILEAEPRQAMDPASLSKLYVPAVNPATSVTQPIPLMSVARVERGTAPLILQNQEQFPSVTLSFDLASGTSLGDAVAAISMIRTELGVPDSVSGAFAGEAQEFARSLAGQPWLILAAVVVIYIVLGVLYESYIHPITILSTLPSAGIGALLALKLTGQDLSLVALIGIVLLMGIVKKNAIMMIDFALDAERERGLDPKAAIIEACVLRFRPIMMTTLAALFGALPLALHHGTGSELRIPLGVTIIGGLLLSQLLTLYTTPVVYLELERLRLWLRRKTGHGPVAAVPKPGE